MWELAHGRILINEAKWKRGLEINGDCSRYMAQMKDSIHLLRDWKDFEEVWLHLVLSTSLSKLFSLPLWEWLEWNLMGLEMRMYEKSLPERKAICCWSQWKWRNDVIFNNNTIPMELRFEILKNMFK